jgi:hypothetical protein
MLIARTVGLITPYFMHPRQSKRHETAHRAFRKASATLAKHYRTATIPLTAPAASTPPPQRPFRTAKQPVCCRSLLPRSILAPYRQRL